jgi:hypothetical protein
MKRATMVRSVLAVTCSLAWLACGVDSSVRPGAAHEVAMQGLMSEEPAAKPDPECRDIQVRLAKERAALQATTEWQAVQKTGAYTKFMTTLHVVKASGCFHHKDPGTICSKLLEQFEHDWSALQATPEYDTAAQTSEYTALKATYGDAKEHHCFDLPGLERPADR